MAPSSTVERFYDLYGTSSSDSGKTWTPNYRVSDRSRDVGAVDDAYFTRVEMDSSTVGHTGSGPTAADALWAGVGAGGILCIAGLALIVVSQRRRSAEKRRFPLRHVRGLDTVQVVTTGGGYDRSWHRVGRAGAYFASVAFLVIIVLSLLDSLGALGSVPGYHTTSAGLVADEATYWKGFYAHQHDILWNIFVRDSLQPLAYIAVVLVSLAVLNVVGPRRATAQIAVAAFALAAVVGCLDALAWLTMGQYWRSDWSVANATTMVAVGRDTEAITNLTHQYTQLGNLALAAGLVLVGLLTRPAGLLPFRLRYLAWTGAALLVLSLVVDQTQLGTLSNVLTLLSALVFPPLLFWIGQSFTRKPIVPRRVAS